MSGAFYPPPPPFVGGSQPNAGNSDLVQSGPTPYPAAPIAAATFAAILVAWLPGPPPVQAQASPQPYQLPAPLQPVRPSHVNLDIIRGAWDPPRPVFKYVGGGDTDGIQASQPPPVSNVTQGIIRANWEPIPWWPLPASPPRVQPGPSLQRAAPNPVVQQIIRATWDTPVWWPLPASPVTARSGPVNLPPPSLANYNLIVDQWWGPRLVFKYVGGGDSDGPPASQPPPISNANALIIRQSWEPVPWWPLPALIQSPQSGPGAILPPPPYDPRPNLQVIVDSWDDTTWTVIFVDSIGSQNPPPQPYAPQPHVIRATWDLPWSWEAYGQGHATIAPLLPVISAPPAPNPALFASLIALNQPPPYAIPSAGTMAGILPGPSKPVPTQAAILRIILQAWDLPPPVFVYPAGLAPFIKAPSQPPVVQNATLRVVLQAWDAPPPPFFYPAGLASQVLPPSPPPPVSTVLQQMLIDSWRAPIWWPLPSLNVMPQSAPVAPPVVIVLPFALRKYLMPNTIINPDASSYVGPLPGPSTVTYPRWMYNPVLPPVLVVNLAQQNQLIALGTGWTITYQPPYPTPNIPPQSVSTVIPTGITDSFNPVGYVAGFTSRILCVPADATSTLAGLLAAGDGWMLGIINTSTTLSLTLLNNASVKPGNSFILPGENSLVIPSQEGAWFQWVAAVGGWMFIS